MKNCTNIVKNQLVIRWLAVYGQPKMLAILGLGFSSGLPLALTASTLAAWLAEAGVSLSAIGLFSVVSLHYALKFLWSPLMDGASLPLLSRVFGRRRSWLIITQLALFGAILFLGLADPAFNPYLTAEIALLVTIFSASQDIVIDAYRVEILKPEQQGAGAAALVLGYRLGMIAATAGALLLQHRTDWHTAYWAMAGLMGVGVSATLSVWEPAANLSPRKGRDGGDGCKNMSSPPSPISRRATSGCPFCSSSSFINWPMRSWA